MPVVTHPNLQDRLGADIQRYFTRHAITIEHTDGQFGIGETFTAKHKDGQTASKIDVNTWEELFGWLDGLAKEWNPKTETCPLCHQPIK